MCVGAGEGGVMVSYMYLLVVNPGNAVLLGTAAKAVRRCCVSCGVVQIVAAVNLTLICKSSLALT